MDQILLKSAKRVARRLLKGVLPMWSLMTKKSKLRGTVLLVVSICAPCHSLTGEEEAQIYTPALQEDAQIDLKHRLQQTHVCALVQTDLMLPDIHNEHLTGGKGEQRALPLKVLVFTSLSAVRTLNIHDEDVLCHSPLGTLIEISLVLAHPDTLGRLSPLILGHDAESSTKQRIEKCTLSCRLRSEDGNDVIVETLAQNVFLLEISWEARVEVLVLVDDLDAMFKALCAGLLTHRCKVAVHGADRWCRDRVHS